MTAGLRAPSSTRLLADQLAAATARALQPVEVLDLPVIELREHAHALTDALLTGFASGDLARALATVRDADAVIVVTPVFRASYSGLFKTFVDVLEDGALDRTPVLLGATGGTARHSLALEYALRPLFAYLRAAVVPTSVFAAGEDLGAGTELTERVERAAGELADAVRLRPRRARPDPFEDPTPFAELLRGR
ncbi:MAG: CE1759 family FMN reductase [Nocardioidaceae bacterium]